MVVVYREIRLSYTVKYGHIPLLYTGRLYTVVIYGACIWLSVFYREIRLYREMVVVYREIRLSYTVKYSCIRLSYAVVIYGCRIRLLYAVVIYGCIRLSYTVVIYGYQPQP